MEDDVTMENYSIQIDQFRNVFKLMAVSSEH